MKIKRTIKPGSSESGQTEIIDEGRMKNICLQVASLTYRQGMKMTPDAEAEARLSELRDGKAIETFYATYERVGD
jgi:hypothetical protein